MGNCLISTIGRLHGKPPLAEASAANVKGWWETAVADAVVETLLAEDEHLTLEFSRPKSSVYDRPNDNR